MNRWTIWRRLAVAGLIALAGAVATTPATAAPGPAWHPAPLRDEPPLPPGWDLDAFLVGLGSRASAFATEPLEWGWEEWAGLGTGVGFSIGAMWGVDGIVRRQLATRRRGHHSHRWAAMMGRLGDGGAYRTAALLGMGVARGLQSERLGTAVFDAWLASEAGGLIGGGVQSLFGRARPRRLEGEHAFEPLCGCAGAFPSVHATRAFSVATALTLDAPDWWGVPVGAVSYGFASAIAVSRIIKDGHWMSDVAAGAGLGVLIGVLVHTASVRVGPLQLGAVAVAGNDGPAFGVAAAYGF